MQLLPDAIKGRVRLPSPAMAVAFIALFAAIAGGAYAAGQINGANIKNNTVGQAKLTPPTRMKLNHNVGAHWGVIDRNSIGSGIADLRSGPYGSFGVTGASAKPPFGTGSLGIQVSGNATNQSPAAEKVAFGNEVDFYNQQVGQPVEGRLSHLPDRGGCGDLSAEPAEHRAGDQPARHGRRPTRRWSGFHRRLR